MIAWSLILLPRPLFSPAVVCYWASWSSESVYCNPHDGFFQNEYERFLRERNAESIWVHTQAIRSSPTSQGRSQVLKAWKCHQTRQMVRKQREKWPNMAPLQSWRALPQPSALYYFVSNFYHQKANQTMQKKADKSSSVSGVFPKWKNGLYFVKPRPFIKTPKQFFRVRSVFSATETRDVRPSWVKANEQRRAIAGRNIWISNLTKYGLKNSWNVIRTFKDEMPVKVLSLLWMLKVSVNYRQLLNLGAAAANASVSM